MDIKGSETLICCGCLSVDRKMRHAQDYSNKQSFLEIVNEHHVQVMQVDLGTVWLCWECEAFLKRFSNFKERVRKAYWTLQNNEQIQNNQSLSQLAAKQLHSVQYSPNDEEQDQISWDVVTDTPDVKQECYIDVQADRSGYIIPDVTADDQTVYSDEDDKFMIIVEDDKTVLYSDDDDKFLIDFSTKTKRGTKLKSKSLNSVKKKRKKKKDSEVQKEIYKEIELNKDEIEEDRQCMRLREEYINSMFKCDKCIISFPNADDLNDHLKKKHEAIAPYKCSVCECVFASEVSYNYHINKHKRRFECVVCMERFGSRRAAEKHYDTAHCHGDNYDYEELSKKKSLKNDSRKDSTASVNGSPMFQCDRCPKTFRWKTSLRKHAETHSIANGDKRRPYCEPCRMSFTTTANLQKHVKTSSNHQIQLKLRKLKESVAGDSATPETQKAELDQIKSSVIKQRQLFCCGQCDRKFQWRGNLLRHMHSHAARAAGELVCHPCNRTFSSIATYQQHMAISRKHVSEDQFKFSCSECNKRFVNKTRLSDHVAWEHLKKYVHVCNHCQKVFKSHTSLYLHLQVVHRKDSAEHLCHHCGKPFPNHAKLRSHITALHSGETPYKCGVCAARFSWHSCLSRHVRRAHRGVGGKGN